MKREEEFLSSIYEKRDKAVEKRRRTVRLVERIGAGVAVCFAAAIIAVAVLSGYGVMKASSAAKEYSDYTDGKNQYGADKTAAATEHIAPFEASHNAAGTDGLPETAAEIATEAECESLNWVESEVATEVATESVITSETTSLETTLLSTTCIDDHTTAAMTECLESSAAYTEVTFSVPGGVADVKYTEVVPSESDPDAAGDLNRMLAAFALGGENYTSGEEIYEGETVAVYKTKSASPVYFFRYRGYYCAVSDPDASLTAIDAVKRAEIAIDALEQS